MNIIEKVSEDLKITENETKKAYDSFWLFIKDYIQNIPLKEELTEDELNKYKTSFNIPCLGKLSCTYDRYKKCKKKYSITSKINETKKD